MGGLQCQSEVHGNSGGAAATLGIHDGKNFAARSFAVHLSLRRSQSDEGFQKIGGGRRTLNELTRSRTHGVHNDLGLRHAANAKQC